MVEVMANGDVDVERKISRSDDLGGLEFGSQRAGWVEQRRRAVAVNLANGNTPTGLPCARGNEMTAGPTKLGHSLSD